MGVNQWLPFKHVERSPWGAFWAGWWGAAVIFLVIVPIIGAAIIVGIARLITGHW